MSTARTDVASDGLLTSLVALKDVAGVAGSFVFTRAGRLLARELPAVFDDDALREASGRLTRIRETFAAVGDDLDVAVIRMGDHKLYLKSLPAGTLCIITETRVNMPALRMASNLVARRIIASVEQLEATPPPPPAPTPRLTADPSTRGTRPLPAGMGGPGARRFRGHTVE
jgi:predicted regulator of Ras-like GTPase activity (Roadblock/LC7/MglB family)